MSKAAINATAEQKALRNIGRIKTLRAAIEKRETKGLPTESYEEELNRRLGELGSLKDQINDL